MNFLHHPSYVFKITKTCNYLIVSILGLTTVAVLCNADLVLAQPLKRGEVVAQVPTAANKLFVNPAGNATGNGSEAAPFKTITQALQIAGDNSVIVLASGTYSAESGETFPLVLKSGVSIQGNAQSQGRDIVINGGGTYMSRTFARQNITILGANNAAISGVTVTNANPRGYGLWIESSSPTVSNNTFTGNNHDGISITGSSAPKIRSNYFYLNGANGMTIYGTSTPKIQENVFEKTGFGININQKAAPLLTNNRIVQNRSGIVTQASARPVLRGNIIEGNTEDGLVAIAMSQPDLGTTTEPGKNVFRQNGRFDINTSASKQVLTAFGNQLERDRISGNLDLSGTVNPNQAQIAQNVPNVSRQPIKPVLTPVASRTTVSPLPPTPLSNGQVPKTTTSRLPAPLLGNGQLPKTTATPNSNVASTGGIDITVPPPENSDSAQTIEVATNVSQGSDTANIPQVDVPPPPIVSGQINPPATIDKNLPVLQSAQIVEAELLPVPGGNIPVGNSRKLPKVPVQQNANPSGGSPPLPPTQATSLGLRYRVTVAADSKSQQEQIRSLVPGAFRTFNHGKVLMQVGAFSDRTKAVEMQQYLGGQGVTGTIEQLN